MKVSLLLRASTFVNGKAGKRCVAFKKKAGVRSLG